MLGLILICKLWLLLAVT